MSHTAQTAPQSTPLRASRRLPGPAHRPAQALALVLTMGAAACSPYSFSKEVASMSSGVDKLSDAFSAGYDGLASDRATKAQIEMVDQRRTILVAPSCDTRRVRADNIDALCVLYMKGTEAPELTDAEKTRADTIKAVRVLKDYANAMAAVTNAADRAAYDEAVAQLAGAVGTLTTPANAAAPGVSVLAPAVVNVGGWLLGTALDQQRFSTLRSAVNAVGKPLPSKEDRSPDSPIRVVTRRLGMGLDMLKVARLEVLGAEVDILVDGLNTRKWSDEAYRKRLVEAQAALAMADALRRSDPKGAAGALADAHDKLVLAVEDSRTNYTSLLEAVGEFTGKVTAVHAALTAMSTSSPTVKKGS
jgi:hypothetical protein